MRAAVGDRIVVEVTRSGAVRRDGEIVGLLHADGTPPFDVLWSDDGRTSVFFPGPDTRIVHFAHRASAGGDRRT